MLLRKLTLKDFRQFKGIQCMEFSEEKENNITLVIAKTGVGKTTIEQAFTWCLYGETNFSDKSLLCKSTAQAMKPNDEETVSVVLEFVHNNTEYKCTCEQNYYKDFANSLKSRTRKCVLEYRGKDGQQEFVKETQIEGEINKILPKELSNYFFFDGERIGNMSKEIAKGKSKEFPEAVKSLLGLSAFESALYHLNGSHNQNSVVKAYNKSFDSSGNNELKKLIDEIQWLEQEKYNAEKRVEKIDDEDLPTIQYEKEKIIEEQRKYSNVKALVNECKIYEENRDKAQNLLQTNRKDFLKLFSEKSYNFFALNLINDAVKSLAEADIKDNGIPDIHARTIDYLINKRHSCLCGTPIAEGSEIHKHLLELLQFIPPQSLGTSIRQFVNTANEKAKNSDFYENFEESYSRIRKSDEDVQSQNDEISRIKEQLAGIDENGIAKLQKDLEYYSQKEQEYVEERGKCKEAISRLTDEINGKEQSKSRFTNIGETNKKISIYLAYAKRIFEEMQKQYQSEEAKVRTQFEETINKIFKEIYNGGLSLKIDEKYNIKIIVNDFNGYNEDVETSTAQSLSVILAFISAVIKMARENENGNKLLVTEAYPLVMDAPLSAFDKTRIQTICEVLPNIAEQVIIFINDKDGEVAEANMKEKIGKKYSFRKENEFETYMEEK